MTPPPSPKSTSSYVCDTIPPARLASADPLTFEHVPMSPAEMDFDIPAVAVEDATTVEISNTESAEKDVFVPPQHPARKLCVRHQRMADEGTNLKLQQSLDALPVEEREAVNAVWTNFSSSPHRRRALILHGLLTMCCFSQLSLLAEQLAHLIRIDPFAVLPREVSLRILQHLDAKSLCRAAQVSKSWNVLADDDILWRGICEQHIGQKCRACGWGLPRLDHKRILRGSPSPGPSRQLTPATRIRGEDPDLANLPSKRQCMDGASGSGTPSAPRSISPVQAPDHPSSALLQPDIPCLPFKSFTRPWKDVYSERLTIERNWRRARCTVRTLTGHKDGVMCLQVSENLNHPSFPILITGSYDRTTRVWNLETGMELRCLKGHTRAVRALQFDEHKLITGSMDHTLRVWDWRNGRCVRTLTGHTEGVVCLNFDSNVLASGSVDALVKVWNFRTGQAFTLRGHKDWVNSVQLWDSDGSSESVAPSCTASVLAFPHNVSSTCTSGNSAPQIDPGKMLFSASDDGTIRLWDLSLRTCVRQFTGHVGQVQSMKLLSLDDDYPNSSSRDGGGAIVLPGAGTRTQLANVPVEHPGYAVLSSTPAILDPSAHAGLADPSGGPSHESRFASLREFRRRNAVLITGSLDNTVKMWDIDTGKNVRTLFGHIEGVWAVASDKLRLVTGSHDRTIKVWNREDGSCTATLVGHRGAVTCISLGEDKIVSGSDDSTIKIWSFAG